jgi:hypothetical protein
MVATSSNRNSRIDAMTRTNKDSIDSNAQRAINAIANATDKPEPCSPNYNSACTVYNGPVNYAPYQSCQ